MVVVFPTPLTPMTMITNGRPAQEIQGFSRDRKKPRNFLPQLFPQFCRIFEFLTFDLFRYFTEENLGGVDPEVRGNQHLLQFVQQVEVDGFFPEYQTINASAQMFSRLLETLPQPPEESSLFAGGVGLRLFGGGLNRKGFSVLEGFRFFGASR